MDSRLLLQLFAALTAAQVALVQYQEEDVQTPNSASPTLDALDAALKQAATLSKKLRKL